MTWPTTLDAGGPGSGLPPSLRSKADPVGALHHSADPSAAALLTSGRRWPAMGSGDRKPPVMRHGSMCTLAQPSRAGQLLRWPDGRITDLQGQTVGAGT